MKNNNITRKTEKGSVIDIFWRSSQIDISLAQQVARQMNIPITTNTGQSTMYGNVYYSLAEFGNYSDGD